tara:strand:- start:13225 stop:13683 length:459 start_codon:yes stop_codon:yes gene_type:complete
MTAIVYIDMDDTICHFRTAFEQAVAANPAIQFPQSQYGFFENLEPIEHAIASIESLLADERFDPYILTAPSIRNPLCYTGKRVWVERYLGLDFCHRLIISARKDLLKGEYLIDDYSAGKGQDTFEGQLIHFGNVDFPDWPTVMAHLDQQLCL